MLQARSQPEALVCCAGIPLKPMLAKICEGIPDALRQLGGTAALAEYKYDGTRAQVGGAVHVDKERCRAPLQGLLPPTTLQQGLCDCTGPAGHVRRCMAHSRCPTAPNNLQQLLRMVQHLSESGNSASA